MAAKRRFGSKTASLVNSWRGSYSPDNGHEGERPARQLRVAADIAKLPELLRRAAK